jgi:hypothetical protein
MWFVTKWRLKAEVLAAENAVLDEYLHNALKDVDHYRERAERATAALLDIQGKPALERPDATGAMNFIDKSFSLFNDTQGGEEVA